MGSGTLLRALPYLIRFGTVLGGYTRLRGDFAPLTAAKHGAILALPRGESEHNTWACSISGLKKIS
jgi:hypothetical protein